MFSLNFTIAVMFVIYLELHGTVWQTGSAAVSRVVPWPLRQSFQDKQGKENSSICLLSSVYVKISRQKLLNNYNLYSAMFLFSRSFNSNFFCLSEDIHYWNLYWYYFISTWMPRGGELVVRILPHTHGNSSTFEVAYCQIPVGPRGSIPGGSRW